MEPVASGMGDGGRTAAAWALALLVGSLLVGCSANGTTTFDPAAERVLRPGWVDRLQERVQEVPPERQPEGARLSTPTRWPASDVGPGRGVPRDLTAPWAGESAVHGATEAAGDGQGGVVPAPQGGGARGAAAEPAPAAAPGAEDSTEVARAGGVTVNVHTVEPPGGAAEKPRPPSALETLYAGAHDGASPRELRQFGYEYFATGIDSTSIGFVTPDYVVLPGDELHVTFSGNFKDEVRRIVAADGTITVPDGGAVTVGGRPFSEVAGIIQRQIESRAKRHDFTVDVSMGQVRGFRVHVVGEVEHPGLVEVPGRANVLTALAVAGGPRKTGSLRKIEVRRRGAVLATVDLYQFLLTGETNGFDVLESEDVIVVPPIGPTVGVGGTVQRPGIYEIVGDITVDDAIRLAGGMTPFTFTPNAQIERTVDGRGRERSDVGLDEAGRRTTLGDGELLLIGAVDSDRQQAVRIEGEVARPGSYPFREHMTVSDLVRQADGMTVDAYLPQAFLSRQIGEVGQVTLVPQREALGTTRRVLVVDLERAMAGDAGADVELRPLDLLMVRSRGAATTTPTVELIGAVRDPGTYELTAGLTVSQLVAIAGNVLPEVYYDEAELIRRAYDPDAKALTIERYRFDLGRALREGGAFDPVLANRDQLVIRSLQASTVRVRIEGRVRFPGSYVFRKGERISRLIAAAKGLEFDADLGAAVFQRESVRKLQEARFEHLRETTQESFERAFEQMVASGFPAESLAARISLDQTKAMLQRMEGFQSDGRIVIPFTREDFPGSVYDLTLEDGDVLSVPAVQETIAIVGHVFNPGAFVAESGVTVGNLIARSGGVRDDADEERVYVIRADGTVQSLQQEHYDLSLDAMLHAGDVVLVPRRPLSRTLGNQLTDFLFATRRAAEIALLLGNIDNLQQLQFTSLLQEPRLDSNIDALQRGLIQSAVNK